MFSLKSFSKIVLKENFNSILFRMVSTLNLYPKPFPSQNHFENQFHLKIISLKIVFKIDLISQNHVRSYRSFHLKVMFEVVFTLKLCLQRFSPQNHFECIFQFKIMFKGKFQFHLNIVSNSVPPFSFFTLKSCSF